MKKMLAFGLFSLMLFGCSNSNDDMSRMREDTRQAFDDVTDDVRDGVNDIERNIRDDYDDMTDNDHANNDTKATGYTFKKSTTLTNVPSFCNATMGHSKTVRQHL